MASVIVVGGGVIGLSAAWHLQQDGHQVTILDDRPGDEANCSTGNAGMVVPSHFVPLAAPGMVSTGLRLMFEKQGPLAMNWGAPGMIPWARAFMSRSNREHVISRAPLLLEMHRRSRARLLEWAQVADFGLVTKGLLSLFRTPGGWQHEQGVAALGASLGAQARVITADEVRQIDPAYDGDIVGGVHFTEDAHLNPAALVSWLRAEFDRSGGQWISSASATGWIIDRGEVRAVTARLPSGPQSLTADAYVLATGATSESLAKPLWLRLLLQPGKGYSTTWNPSPIKPSVCALLMEDRIAITPMAGGVRVAGTMEIGAKPQGINPEKIAGMQRGLPAWFTALRPEAPPFGEIWSGLRPLSPDGMPYLGHPLRHRNVVVATGHGMMGISLAAVTGQVVADLVAGRNAPFALDMLRPDRFL